MALPETTNSTYGPGPHTSDHDAIHDILNVITEQGVAGQVLAKSASINPSSFSGARLEYITLPDSSQLLSRAGGTMTGAIAMGGNKITSLGTPTAVGDASTKGYIDTHTGVVAGLVQTITHTASGALPTLNAASGHTIIANISANVTGFGTWTTWQPGQFASIWFVNVGGSSATVNLSSLTALPNESLGTITLGINGVYLLVVTSHNWTTKRYVYSGVLMEAGT